MPLGWFGFFEEAIPHEQPILLVSNQKNLFLNLCHFAPS